MKLYKTNKKLDLSNLPTHLAIILDGNGRWASKRGLPRIAGHKKGAENLESVLNYAFSLRIPVISIFAFSTENWKRPKEEVEGIFDILRDFIKTFNSKSEKEQTDEIKNKNIKIVVSGDITRLPEDLANEINKKIHLTKDCTGGILNIALNYGGRADIVQACNKLLAEKRSIVTEQEFQQALYTKDLPPVDFAIRTGGDIRISNFMLYQMAYAELYFIKTYWPDFNKKQLDIALIDYQKRKRKFGNISI